MFPTLSLSYLLLSQAHGGEEADRLVVRLDTAEHPLQGAVIARFVTKDGTGVAFALNDAGTSPDTTAGDGVWSGVGVVAGTTAKLTVSSPDWTGDAGSLALPPGRQHDLDLAISGARIVPSGALGAAASGGADDRATPGDAGTVRRKGGGAGSASGEGGGGRRRNKAEAESAPAPNDLWYLAAAGAGLCLLAVGFLSFRRPQRAAALPVGVRRLAEAGLFGSGSPPISAGISQWVVSAADEHDLVLDLVRQVAALRPVLVQAGDDVELPGTRGGTAYRASYGRPAELQDAVDDLREVHPTLALVLVAPSSPGALAEWTRDMGGDLPILAVVRQPVPGVGPGARCTRPAGEWEFETLPVQ